jgi:PAS domain S-box-containing protein
MPIRVLLADDDSAVRQGLRMFLATDRELDIVCEAGDGIEALRLARQLQPDVVFMDLLMPKMDCIQATAAIRRQIPGTEVVALTSVEDYVQYKAWWTDSRKPVEPHEWASAQAVEKGESVFGQVLEIQRNDGGHRFVLNSSVPIRDEEGRVIGSAVAIQDITELRRAEQALRESEERFRTVIENSRDGINMLNLETGRYVFMSPAQIALTGFSDEEMNNLQAEEAYERVHPDDREKSVSQQREIAEGRDQGSTIEYRWKVKSGEYRWFSDSRTLVRNAQGRPIALVGVSRDITDQKQAQEELRRREAELALASHERAITEERQRLARELHDSVSQALYGISLGVNTALTLLDADRDKVIEALNYSLSQTQTALAEMRALIFALRPEALATEGVVAALGRETAALIARRDVEIELNLCDEPDVSLAVKEVLYRIAQEAMRNAVKHTRCNRMTVRMTLEGDGLSLEVSDNGGGFDPQAAYPGHLGLRSMRERVTSVGGSLDISSPPDRCTQIRAHIPIPPAEAM